MKTKLNLIEILMDCPKGTKFYTTTNGYVYFDKIDLYADYPIYFNEKESLDGQLISVTYNGHYTDEEIGECIVFPSEENRDWSTFILPKPKLEYGTPVMVLGCDIWKLGYYVSGNIVSFSNSKDKNDSFCYQVIIPFDKFDPNNIEKSMEYCI